MNFGEKRVNFCKGDTNFWQGEYEVAAGRVNFWRGGDLEFLVEEVEGAAKELLRVLLRVAPDAQQSLSLSLSPHVCVCVCVCVCVGHLYSGLSSSTSRRNSCGRATRACLTHTCPSPRHPQPHPHTLSPSHTPPLRGVELSHTQRPR
eukprot:1919456-Rhodomonas_salina.1